MQSIFAMYLHVNTLQREREHAKIYACTCTCICTYICICIYNNPNNNPNIKHLFQMQATLDDVKILDT